VNHSAAPAVIVTRDLERRFGKIAAVAGVSFSVRRGEVFALLGPNGSGKTTLIRMLCGVVVPSGGEARVLDYDVATESDAIKARVGYMSQRFGLYNKLTVAENLRFYAAIYGVPRHERDDRVDEILEQLGLQDRERQRTGTLSGGWKQRLALACSIVHSPAVLFLDEPTAGVDPFSRRRFWSMIHRLSKEGITVFLTTHYLDEAESADRVALMYDGRLAALDTAANLISAGLRGRIVEIRAPQPLAALNALQSLPGVRDMVSVRSRVRALLNDGLTPNQVQAALDERGVVVDEVRQVAPTLEDVFISLLEGSEEGDRSSFV